jgi:hypothetical protein
VGGIDADNEFFAAIAGKFQFELAPVFCVIETFVFGLMTWIRVCST